MEHEIDKAEEIAGRELRRLRTERGWTQEEVARRMAAYGHDWHQTFVAKTEAAQRPLRLNEAADLAALFGMSLDSLLASGPLAEAETALRAAEIEEAESRRAAQDASALHAVARKRTKAAWRQLADVQAGNLASRVSSDLYAFAKEIVAAGLSYRGLWRPCADCGTDTVPDDGPYEYYNVYNEVWEQAGMERDGGFLCIGCLEKRLGRPLHRADFGHAPINVPYLVRGQSRRLLEALEREPGEPAGVPATR